MKRCGAGAACVRSVKSWRGWLRPVHQTRIVEALNWASVHREGKRKQDTMEVAIRQSNVLYVFEDSGDLPESLSEPRLLHLVSGRGGSCDRLCSVLGTLKFVSKDGGVRLLTGSYLQIWNNYRLEISIWMAQGLGQRVYMLSCTTNLIYLFLIHRFSFILIQSLLHLFLQLI